MSVGREISHNNTKHVKLAKHTELLECKIL